MKTLKSILQKPDYKARDHSADAKKFAEKHVIKKTADANGNDDELFNASKVKKVGRKKERHGHEPGEDAKMYESVKESIAAYLDESGEEISEEDLDSLVEETLDELSKKTLGSYIKKASDRAIDDSEDKGWHSRGTNSYDKDSTDNKKKHYYRKQVRKRERGISSAVKKLTREDVVDSLIDRYAPESQLTNEEKLELKLENYSNSEVDLLSTLMNTLSEANQLELIASLNDKDSVNEMINFAIDNGIQEMYKKPDGVHVEKISGNGHFTHRIHNTKNDYEEKSTDKHSANKIALKHGSKFKLPVYREM